MVTLGDSPAFPAFFWSVKRVCLSASRSSASTISRTSPQWTSSSASLTVETGEGDSSSGTASRAAAVYACDMSIVTVSMRARRSSPRAAKGAPGVSALLPGDAQTMRPRMRLTTTVTSLVVSSTRELVDADVRKLVERVFAARGAHRGDR
jgi:hypothetical protein